MTDTQTKTYVYNGTEVKMTGREAIKERTNVNRRTREKEVTNETRYEVTPANDRDGDWKKWVELSELFAVK